MAVVAGLVLAALTALAWWVSGRWLERPDAAPERPQGPERARSVSDPSENRR
jgi:hypothetical protein